MLTFKTQQIACYFLLYIYAHVFIIIVTIIIIIIITIIIIFSYISHASRVIVRA